MTTPCIQYSAEEPHATHSPLNLKPARQVVLRLDVDFGVVAVAVVVVLMVVVMVIVVARNMIVVLPVVTVVLMAETGGLSSISL